MFPRRAVWRFIGMVLGVAALCTVWAGAAAPIRMSGSDAVNLEHEEEAEGRPAFLAAPNEQTVQNGVRYQLDGQTASVVGYTADIPGVCTIPAQIQVDGTWYTVSAIADSGFYNCAQIQSIQLPGTLERIGTNAFNGCTGLKEITIPASVTEIGAEDGAFVNCSALTGIQVEDGNPDYVSVDGVLFGRAGTLYCYPIGKTETTYTVPEGTERINACAFYRADQLREVTLPDTVTEIGEEAFYECSWLEHIDLGHGLETVGWNAFAYCGNLKTLSFPATLQELQGGRIDGLSKLTAYEVAEGCSSYYTLNGVLFARLESGVQLWAYPENRDGTEYTVPDEVTVLGAMAFNGATKLQEIHFTPSSKLQSIEFGVFTGCSGLIRITIPDTVTEMGSYVFQNCRRLEEIHLGTGIMTLTEGMFHSCRSLTEVTIPSNVTTIANTAFRECTALERFYVEEGNTAFYAADGVLYSLGNEQRLVAYPAARSESTLTVPAGVAEISAGCFSASTSLREFRVEEGSTTFYAIDGVLFQRGTSGDTLHSYPAGKSGAQYRVPDGVTAIAEMAFYRNYNVTDVDANQVKIIGKDAFFQSNLTQITMSNVEELGTSALLLTRLKKVVFPESLRKIGGQVLDFCDDLEYIEFRGANPPEGRNDLCYEAEGLRYVYVPDGCQGAYKSFFTNGIYPGAMIVEGTYRPAETVEGLINGLDDSSDAAAIHEAAAAVVRLTGEDAEKLSDADLLKVEALFRQANQALQVTTDAEAVTTDVTVEGAALASGLVEQGEAGAVAGAVAVSVREEALTESDELLNLAFELTVDGQEKSLQSPVIVTVALTETMAQAADWNELRLVHRISEWEEEPVEYTIQDGNVTFRAASFSNYVFLRDTQTPEGVQRVQYIVSGAATLYLAGYDETGRMVSLQGVQVTGSGAEDFQPGEGVSFKAFLLDENQRPVGTVILAE